MSFNFYIKFSKESGTHGSNGHPLGQFGFRQKTYFGHLYLDNPFSEQDFLMDVRIRDNIADYCKKILFLHQAQVDNCYLKSIGKIEGLGPERIYFKRVSLTHEIDLEAIEMGSADFEISEKIEKIHQAYNKDKPLGQLKIQDLVSECRGQMNKLFVSKNSPIETASATAFNPAVKGVVHVASLATGFVGLDSRFEFAKYLKFENQTAVPIRPSDFYVPLKGVFEGSEMGPLSRDAKGQSWSPIYLPSSLFKDVKEGGTIRFFYADIPIELMCKQYSDEKKVPQNVFISGGFNAQLLDLEESIGPKVCKYMWQEDVPIEEKFSDFCPNKSLKKSLANFPVGKPLHRIYVDDEEKQPISDLKFYEEDQKQNGNYVTFSFLWFSVHGEELPTQSSNPWIKKMIPVGHFGEEVLLSDFHFIQTCSAENSYALLMIIPHKPEKNTVSLGEEVTVSGITPSFEDQTYVGEESASIPVSSKAISFDPSKGHRRGFYHFGQACLIPLSDPIEKIERGEVTIIPERKQQAESPYRQKVLEIYFSPKMR